jgi:hypothetical protein
LGKRRQSQGSAERAENGREAPPVHHNACRGGGFDLKPPNLVATSPRRDMGLG